MIELDATPLKNYYQEYCKANEITPDNKSLKRFLKIAEDRIEEMAFGGIPVEMVVEDYIEMDAKLDMKYVIEGKQ